LPKTYLNKIKVIDNIIWLCTNNGLLAVSKTSFKLLHTFFNNIRVTDIVEDHEGGLWVSSVEKGLYYIPNLSIDVFEYSDYSINTIAPGPQETLFLGTGNGEVIQINKNAQVIARFATDFNTEIEYLLYDFELNRLVSSHGYFDFSNPSNVAYEPLRLGKFATKDIHGNYIINTYNKAILVNSNLSSLPSNYSKDNPIIGIYNTEGFPFVSLFDNRTRTSIFVPGDSSYLIGTSQNLISLNRFGEERIITFNTKPILATNMLLLGETVYIGTLQDGVLALHHDKIRQVASAKTGLSSNICKKIIHSNGQLLVVTDNDINTIDVKTEKVGILTNAIYFRKLNISDFFVTDSTYWLATNEGLVRFELTPENSSTLPIITSLNALSVKSQSFIENTTSSYTENDVQIQVDAIFYKSLGSFNYEYRLLGYDSVWRNQNAINQTFNYLSLASGNYTFQIRTKVGDKRTETHELHFTIPKPFWRKLWFILIAIFSIPLIAYLIAQYFLNKNKQKQLVKEKLLKSQLIALRAQMNPHFMFNVLNSVQGLIYTNKKNEASIFLGKFSNLMRRTLESSEKSNITISKEIELIQLYLELEAARFEDEFTYEIIIDLNHDQLETEIPTMVIQPFIENALKHGLLHRIGAKELYIKFSMDGDYLSVLILDNGVGRRASGEINAKRKNHQSFATNAINTRVKLINEHNHDAVKIAIIDLEDEYGSGKGTQVTIKIKLI
jgi:hypothetical protein